MTISDFNRLTTLIFKGYGIKLPQSKKTMLEGRLRQRLKKLNIATLEEYCDYVFSAEGQRFEVSHMIDVVTTNKTDFFREPAHFDFLITDFLPNCFKDHSTLKPLNIWSAACSTGEEPYSLAMVLSDFSTTNLGFDFNIVATDISGRALDTAATAIYTNEKVIPVPQGFKKKFLLKNKDSAIETVRIIPELRYKVKFKRFNLIDGDTCAYPNFDVIFCRNVLIYFDRPTQEK